MRFDIWMEGYRATGNEADAEFCGTYEAETFEEACLKWAKEKNYIDEPYQGRYRHEPQPAFWGCRLFDNETDAREYFG